MAQRNLNPNDMLIGARIRRILLIHRCRREVQKCEFSGMLIIQRGYNAAGSPISAEEFQFEEDVHLSTKQRDL